MLKYLAKRIARSFITLFIVITIVFSLLRLMPIEGYFNNYEKTVSYTHLDVYKRQPGTASY